MLSKFFVLLAYNEWCLSGRNDNFVMIYERSIHIWKKGKKKKKSLKGGGKLNGIWRKFCSHREIHKFKYINFSRQGRKRRSGYENFQPDCTLSQSISLFAVVSESFALRWQEINFFYKVLMHHIENWLQNASARNLPISRQSTTTSDTQAKELWLIV